MLTLRLPLKVRKLAVLRSIEQESVASAMNIDFSCKAPLPYSFESFNRMSSPPIDTLTIWRTAQLLSVVCGMFAFVVDCGAVAHVPVHS